MNFKATLFEPDATEKVGSGILLSLPKDVSEKLSSRGMAIIMGSVNDFPFRAVIEPDGKGSHWFRFNETLQEATGAGVGDTVNLEVEQSKDWPEPKVPADLRDALAADPVVRAVWDDITPMARWDWIRWIGSTRNPETRARRVLVSCDKMLKGTRRPCCFNRTECTLTEA